MSRPTIADLIAYYANRTADLKALCAAEPGYLQRRDKATEAKLDEFKAKIKKP